MTRYPFIYQGLTSPDFLQSVQKFARDNEDKFRGNGPTGKRKFYSTPPEAFADQHQRMAEHFGFTGWIPEPMFGNFIGWQIEGGAVHPHTDPSAPGYAHTRINIMISKPLSGGYPILDDIPVYIDEGEVWLNFASECLHSSSPVVGDKPRMVLSLGYQVPIPIIQPFIRSYRQWVAETKDK